MIVFALQNKFRCNDKDCNVISWNVHYKKNNHMLFYFQNIFLSTCLDNENAPKIQCRQSDNTEVCKILFTCYPQYNENNFVDTWFKRSSLYLLWFSFIKLLLVVAFCYQFAYENRESLTYFRLSLVCHIHCHLPRWSSG